MSFRTAAFAASAVLVVMASFAASADDCGTAWNAMRTGIQKHYTSTITITHKDGKPQTSHVVMMGDKMYVEVRGAWHTVPMSSTEMLADMDQKRKTTKAVCHRVGDETVGGQPATIYAVHSENEGHVSDNKIWVSKALGLPIKSESHMGDMVVVSTNDYSNVRVPAGVH
jgi:outer membrane lipoprotein-sorting protein